MKNVNWGQWFFYTAFATGIYLYLNPSKDTAQYYKWLVVFVAGWVMWTSFWNLLVASKIIVANKRMQRKIENSKTRFLHMGLAVMWFCVAGYILLRTLQGKALF
jgi:uncharacterized membrane protein